MVNIYIYRNRLSEPYSSLHFPFRRIWLFYYFLSDKVVMMSSVKEILLVPIKWELGFQHLCYRTMLRFKKSIPNNGSSPLVISKETMSFTKR